MLRWHRDNNICTIRHGKLISTTWIYSGLVSHCKFQWMDYVQHLELECGESLSRTFGHEVEGYCKATGPYLKRWGKFCTLRAITTKTAVGFSRSISASQPYGLRSMIIGLTICTDHVSWLCCCSICSYSIISLRLRNRTNQMSASRMMPADVNWREHKCWFH